jgi:hypothetical protein
MGANARWPRIKADYWSAGEKIFNALEKKDGAAALEALRSGLKAMPAAADDVQNCWWQVAGCILNRTDIGPHDGNNRGFVDIIHGYTLLEPAHWALAAVYEDHECLWMLDTYAYGHYPDGEGPGSAAAYLNVVQRVRQTMDSEGHADLHELYRRFSPKDRQRLTKVWKLLELHGDVHAADRTGNRLFRGRPEMAQRVPAGKGTPGKVPAPGGPLHPG